VCFYPHAATRSIPIFKFYFQSSFSTFRTRTICTTLYRTRTVQIFHTSLVFSGNYRLYYRNTGGGGNNSEVTACVTELPRRLPSPLP